MSRDKRGNRTQEVDGSSRFSSANFKAEIKGQKAEVILPFSFCRSLSWRLVTNDKIALTLCGMATTRNLPRAFSPS